MIRKKETATAIPRRQRHTSSVHREVSEVLYERRLLTFITGLAGLGVLLWLVALSTDFWIVVVPDDSENGIDLRNITGEDRVMLWSHSGLWKCCIIYRELELNETLKECLWHHTRKGVNIAGISDFMRGELAVCVITVAVIFLSAGFSVYSLMHPRYTFKRIAGMLHVLVAIMLIVLMEMVKSEAHLGVHRVSRARLALSASTSWFGYSYLLACVVCIIFFVAGFAFFANSRKRKMLPFDFDENLH